ncbi:MAG TPA: DUF2461 domain-containing protein [Gammaproteobacteria bacterium]|nr:DUF2461 domain-containing protein [Gammaproteobacteria bacterium]
MAYFSEGTLGFLEDLARNNNRDWFQAHKQDYEERVRSPALDFIADMADGLSLISPQFLAIPKKVGGSLMRVYRDTRFTRDKTPYKTNIGIQFRHHMGKDVHAPGYYVHIEPGACFIGVGIWRPDREALDRIRQAIVENERAWLAARDDGAFRDAFTLSGEALKRPPRGYPGDHPLVEDLKRKDFIAIAPVEDEAVLAAGFRAEVLGRFADATPFMRFLCRGLGLNFD